MMNQQLVDYIKQQLAAGVQKETVRKALADAGWAVADIDDSLKAAEPVAVAPVASPAAAPIGTSSTASINPSVAMGGIDTSLRGTTKTGGASDKFFSQSTTTQASQTKPLMGDDDEDEQPSAKKFVVAMIVMGAIILLLAGALTFVYFNLSGKLATAEQGSGDSGQATALQNQVNQLTKEKSDLNGQINQLTTDNQSLIAELSFFAPASSATSTGPVSATVKGTLSGNATTTFVLTTSHNVKISVANSKDAKVTTALTPLANGTTAVTLTGTHAPASPNLTVTAVNGTPL